MGYMQVFGDCYACKRPFYFNADRVPSVRIDGVREPVCKECMEMANRLRKEKGLPALVILPDAYEAQEV